MGGGPMTLQEQRTALIVYLTAKLQQEDWHGVSDAANDLRVLDVQIQITKPSDAGHASSPSA